ncbi:MAG: diacylglycerol kinase family lipid kinase [Ruminococcus sp.]|nr:diacylglycerol kinase family lipid kinase [Ruminococcus sp.]
MKHLFIINKTAGKGESFGDVLAQLDKINSEDIVIKYTERAGHATELARAFVRECGDFVRVYACGGDGTVNEAISGIYDLDNCAFAPIPTGSGNDFIRSFDCKKEDFLNVEKMMNGKEVCVDLLKCNDRISCNSVTIGFDCAVAKNVEKFKKKMLISSSFAYKLSIFYCLFNGRKHNFKIIVDGEECKNYGTYLLSLCAKGKYYGGGIKCAPRADNSDGMIDLLIIPTVGVIKFIGLLPSFTKGEHLDNPKADFITHKKCREVEYISETPVEIGVDGEILTVSEAKISVLPKTLKVILPS